MEEHTLLIVAENNGLFYPQNLLFHSDPFFLSLYYQTYLWCTECSRCCLTLVQGSHCSLSTAVFTSVLGFQFPLLWLEKQHLQEMECCVSNFWHGRKILLDARWVDVFSCSFLTICVLHTTFRYGYEASKHFRNVDSPHVQFQTGFLCKIKSEWFF